MYEDHYGLRHRPFGETVSAAAYVAVPSRDASLRRLRYGLEARTWPRPALRSFRIGQDLDRRRLALDLGVDPVHLTFPDHASGELLTLLAEEFVARSTSLRRWPGALRRLRDHLAAVAGTGNRLLLIVDEAHLIRDPETFEALRMLLNFATAGPPDLSLLLVGTAEVLLQLPHGLADRLTARSLLGPFTDAESSAYVLGRLADAGAWLRSLPPPPFPRFIGPLTACPAASTTWLTSLF